MGTPTSNISEEFSGVRYFRDLTDPTLWYYPPAKAPWTYSRSAVGTHVIWNGRLEIHPDAGDMQKFISSHDNCQLLPLPVQSEQNDIDLAFAITAPNTSKVRILPNLPFPTISFSATLDTTDANYGNLDSTIKDGLKKGTLLTGGFVFSIQWSEVVFQGRLILDLRDISNTLGSSATEGWLLESDLRSNLFGLVQGGFKKLFSIDFGATASLDEVQIKSFAYLQITHSLIALDEDMKVFDQGVVIKRFKLREPLEFLPAPIVFALSRSAVNLGVFNLAF